MKVRTERKLNGVMIFYIDVGQLPPYKAEAFIERMKDAFKKKKDRFKDSGIETIWIPVRPNSQTRVEFFPISEEGKAFKVESTNQEIEIDEKE